MQAGLMVRLLCKGTHTRTCQDVVCAGGLLTVTILMLSLGLCGMQEPLRDSPTHGAEQGMILSRFWSQTLSFSHLMLTLDQGKGGQVPAFVQPLGM